MGCVFSEDVLWHMRGNDVTKEAFKLLKASGLNFRGNIEGHDLFEKPAELVVCHRFTGDVVLKQSPTRYCPGSNSSSSGIRFAARRKARRRCVQVDSEKDQL